jgi:signal transduction histidine kinase
MPFTTAFRGERRWLAAGFGALLVLIGVAGVDALAVLRAVRTSETQVRDTYLRRDTLVEEIRTGIYQSATVVRDYLLSGGASDARLETEQWREVRAKTEAAVQAFSADMDARDRPLFDTLNKELASYWRLQEDVLSHPVNRKDGPYYSGELRARRSSMLGVADRLDSLHTQQLLADDAKLSGTFDQMRSRLLFVLAACVALGILLAAFTLRRTLRLEAEIEARYGESLRARQEAQDLSARLLSAQEHERRAISRELHDEVGQSLSALLMEAGHAVANVPPNAVEVRRHVESIKRLAEASVQVIRNMTLLLRPSMLDDFGLVPALEWQAREVSKRTGLLVLVNAEESASELPDEHKTCIYRVVQEALHNCARHSQAHRVNVEVHVEERGDASRICLSVEDDGKGFDAQRVRGLGLAGMAERVNHLGGAFRVHSRPGAGTQLEVELPLAS